MAGSPNQRKPRVLIIGPVPSPLHGVSVFTQHLLESEILGESFRIIHLDTSDHRDGENINQLDLSNIVLAIKHILEINLRLLVQRPELVYLPISQGMYGYLRDALFIVSALIFKKKIVVHAHGGGYKNFIRASPGWMKWIIRKTLSNANRVIVLGQAMMDMFDGFVPEERIRAVPNGVKIIHDRYPGDSRNNDPPKIIFLGNLKISKGLLVTIEAARQVLDSPTPAKFLFAGGWYAEAEKEAALERIKDLDLSKHVEFLGVVQGMHKEALLESCDVQVFPSYNEGHPLVILEGMAAGLPIVTTNTGAIPETVLDGKTGFIVPVDDPQALAEKIGLLVEDANLRNMMGRAAHRRFLALYTLENSHRRLRETIFEGLRE